MGNIRILSLLSLAMIGISLGLSSQAFGDDDPVLATMNQAHDLLHKAWGAGADTPRSTQDRIDLLKQAKDILKHAPPTPYYRHRKEAIRFINAALFELDKGDPDKKATDYIRSADSQVRDIE
jgi:hypothetical protein